MPVGLQVKTPSSHCFDPEETLGIDIQGGIVPLQDIWAAYRQTILSVNGLRTLIMLLKTVSKELQLQGPLSSLQKQGKLLVPGLNARLEPAQDCVHAFTAPRTLLQRSSMRNHLQSRFGCFVDALPLQK